LTNPSCVGTSFQISVPDIELFRFARPSGTSAVVRANDEPGGRFDPFEEEYKLEIKTGTYEVNVCIVRGTYARKQGGQF
jgi:hypothetical protein